MLALLVTGPGSAAVTDVPEPVPGPGEVLVSVAAAGICGSDLELLDGRRPAAYVSYPVVPGHEWAGRVEAVDPQVRDLASGDPVGAEGLRSCVASGLLEAGMPLPGMRVAVVGDGPLGLLALLLVQTASPAELVLVGGRPARSALGPPR